VIAPAKTGKDRSNKTAVIKTDQANKGIRSKIIPNARKLPSVLIKFTAPKIELTPAKCNEKIAKSTELPACAMFLDRGGYTVHPVPAPLSTNDLDKSIISAGIRNQNLILFIRGNAISLAPSIRGTNQFPNPPIKIGITIKKIIINACAVTTTL
jgi:hypothetical protein